MGFAAPKNSSVGVNSPTIDSSIVAAKLYACSYRQRHESVDSREPNEAAHLNNTFLMKSTKVQTFGAI